MKWIVQCRMPQSVFVAAFAVLAACAAPPAPPLNMKVTFQNREPIRIDAVRIKVTEAYTPNTNPPHIEHLYQQTPATLARRWASERLNPVGQSGQVMLIIKEASVIEEPLPVTKGLSGLFANESEVRLQATLKARLEYVELGERRRSFVADVEAKADRTIPEGATLNERDLAYFSTLERLAVEFDKALSNEVSRAMAPIIL